MHHQATTERREATVSPAIQETLTSNLQVNAAAHICIAGRLQYFYDGRIKHTDDPIILSWVYDYKILLKVEPIVQNFFCPVALVTINSFHLYLQF